MKIYAARLSYCYCQDPHSTYTESQCKDSFPLLFSGLEKVGVGGRTNNAANYSLHFAGLPHPLKLRLTRRKDGSLVSLQVLNYSGQFRRCLDTVRSSKAFLLTKFTAYATDTIERAAPPHVVQNRLIKSQFTVYWNTTEFEEGEMVRHRGHYVLAKTVDGTTSIQLFRSGKLKIISTLRKPDLQRVIADFRNKINL